MSMFDDSSSLLGKRKGHPLSDELDGGTYGDGVSSEGGDEVVRDKGAHNKNKVSECFQSFSMMFMYANEEMRMYCTFTCTCLYMYMYMILIVNLSIHTCCTVSVFTRVQHTEYMYAVIILYF